METVDGKKSLVLWRSATKNYIKQGNHVQIENIRLGDSNPKKELQLCA